MTPWHPLCLSLRLEAMPQILRMIRIPRGEEQTLEPIAEKTPFLPLVIPTPAVPCTPSPSIRPSWVQRSVSAVRDFPLGCGSRASSVRPPMPYAPSLGTPTPIAYHVH